MASNNLTFNFDGILMKNQTVSKKGNVFQKMTIRITDVNDVSHLINELSSWAGTSALSELKNCIPENSDDIPWKPKLPIPLSEYSLYFHVNFGVSKVNPDDIGMSFDARLVAANFIVKRDKELHNHLECNLEFEKNQDSNDGRLNMCFLQHTTINEQTQKTELELFGFQMIGTESFPIGSMASAPSED